MRHRQPGVPPGAVAGPVKAGLSALLCLVLEFLLWAILYGVYAETIGLLSDVYLSELPGAGPVFAAVDEDLTVSHAIAAMLAFVSCAVPVFIWSEVLARRIYADPQAWLSEPGHQIAAVFAGLMLAVVFALEIVNLYTLIARQGAATILPAGGRTELMAFLAENKGLAVFVSVLMAVVNVAVGFFTVVWSAPLGPDRTRCGF